MEISIKVSESLLHNEVEISANIIFLLQSAENKYLFDSQINNEKQLKVFEVYQIHDKIKSKGIFLFFTQIQ